MASSRSEDEVRADMVAAMGEELGELHFLLWRDVAHLHFEWMEYRELFGTTADRIDLMNRAAAGFFSDLERLYWQDILLDLSCLADPPGTGGQKNVTLRRVLPLVRDDRLRTDLNAALDRVEASVAFAKDWRNRLLAHREYQHAAKPGAHALKPASRAAVESALDAIRRAMNLVETAYGGPEVHYDVGGTRITGAFDLLVHLDSGLAANEKLARDGTGWRPRFK